PTVASRARRCERIARRLAAGERRALARPGCGVAQGCTGAQQRRWTRLASGYALLRRDSLRGARALPSRQRIGGVESIRARATVLVPVLAIRRLAARRSSPRVRRRRSRLRPPASRRAWRPPGLPR